VSTEPHTDVLRSFDDARINRLADIARLPADADRERFAEGVRQAARIYVREIQAPNDNKLHAEIAALHAAAQHKRYGRVADLLERLSPEAIALLRKRRLNVQMPTSTDLREPDRQLIACEAVFSLSQRGGANVEDRLRGPDKRSRKWRPLLVGPKARRHVPKRDAERNFIMWLQTAWLEATGEPPSLAANARRPGPFTLMVREALRLVGGGHADAVGLINELNRSRKIPPVRHQN
jgi:hypothetical protein